MRAKFAFWRPVRAALLTIVFTAACGVEGEDPTTSETSSELSVAGAIGGSCSTASVLGLSKQIAEEVECISPAGTLAPFHAGNGVRFSSTAVLPYLSRSAKDDLHRAASRGRIDVNSGYRTVAQQYVLYRWYREGRCGIRKAAPPGTSNHEGARAVDLANWANRIQAMAAHHWAHDVAGDPVHFDHLTSHDIRGRDVRAFQLLWNRNHPGDKIRVTGTFTSATAARLRRAPATGFAKGPTCAAARMAADVLAVDGPDQIAAGQSAHYTVTIANTSTTDWPEGAQVGPTHLDYPIPAGEQGTIELDIAAPPEPSVSQLRVPLEVEGAAFELAVTLGGDSGLTSIEGDDENDEFDATADEDGVIAD